MNNPINIKIPEGVVLYQYHEHHNDECYMYHLVKECNLRLVLKETPTINMHDHEHRMSYDTYETRECVCVVEDIIQFCYDMETLTQASVSLVYDGQGGFNFT
jgi:hypothetical protein